MPARPTPAATWAAPERSRSMRREPPDRREDSDLLRCPARSPLPRRKGRELDFDLSPDQRLFVESTRDFIEKTMPLTEVRELGKQGHGFDRSWWTRGAELGWTSLLIPEESGGGSVSGEGLLDLTALAEELGRTV